MQTEKYDIIVCGGGMAGLSLVYRALKEGVWLKEKILILDKDIKDQNDKTWCFWQKEEEVAVFEEVIFRKWEELLFFSNDGGRLELDTQPYVYNMIRSIDFYKHVLSFVGSHDQVHFIHEKVISVENEIDGGVVTTDQSVYKARYIFNSIYTKPELKAHNQYFLQHFKGITLQTEEFKGNSSEMHFMDFRTSQKQGIAFFYTLPLSQNQLFTEYTLFSKSVLHPEEYDREIKKYLADVLNLTSYKIIEEEFGVIPMSDSFPERRCGNIMHIGTAGGDTRASTGYTFINTQKTISKILESIKNTDQPFFKTENISFKHKLLDSTILNVWDNDGYPGDQIFTDLFAKVRASVIFRFLDGESTVSDDLSVMLSLKANFFTGPFIRVLLNRWKELRR